MDFRHRWYWSKQGAQNINWADYLIVAACVSSAGLGFWRGFVKEVFGFVALLMAIWLAWRFAPLVDLGVWVVAPDQEVWIARGLIFFVLMVIAALLAWLVRGLIRGAGLGAADRVLGSLFGFARGVVLVGLAVIIMEETGLDKGRRWQEAKLRPHSDRVGGVIRDFAELGGEIVREQEII
ncbi:MAG: CvpA family protein [Gammaproteobacteria bacterium]